MIIEYEFMNIILQKDKKLHQLLSLFMKKMYNELSLCLKKNSDS